MEKSNNYMVFARNLRHQMELKGVTRKELSAALGISYTTLADWYNGVKYPRITALETLANYFGVPKSALTEEEQPITFDDFTFAFLDETKQLTRENKEKLLEMARFFKTQQEKDL